MKEHALSVFYSQILLELSSKSNMQEKYLGDLQTVFDLFENNKSLHQALLSPAVTSKEKQRIVQRLFEKELDEPLLAFIKNLTQQCKINLLPSIIQSFSYRLQKQKELLGVKIIVSEPLHDQNRLALMEKLQNAYGKTVELHEKVDPRIIGGMVLLFSDNKMLDYSLKSKLNRLKDILKGKDYALES